MAEGGGQRVGQGRRCFSRSFVSGSTYIGQSDRKARNNLALRIVVATTADRSRVCRSLCLRGSDEFRAGAKTTKTDWRKTKDLVHNNDVRHDWVCSVSTPAPLFFFSVIIGSVVSRAMYDSGCVF